MTNNADEKTKQILENKISDILREIHQISNTITDFENRMYVLYTMTEDEKEGGEDDELIALNELYEKYVEKRELLEKEYNRLHKIYEKLE